MKKKKWLYMFVLLCFGMTLIGGGISFAMAQGDLDKWTTAQSPTINYYDATVTWTGGFSNLNKTESDEMIFEYTVLTNTVASAQFGVGASSTNNNPYFHSGDKGELNFNHVGGGFYDVGVQYRIVFDMTATVFAGSYKVYVNSSTTETEAWALQDNRYPNPAPNGYTPADCLYRGTHFGEIKGADAAITFTNVKCYDASGANLGIIMRNGGTTPSANTAKENVVVVLDSAAAPYLSESNANDYLVSNDNLLNGVVAATTPLAATHLAEGASEIPVGANGSVIKVDLETWSTKGILKFGNKIPVAGLESVKMRIYTDFGEDFAAADLPITSFLLYSLDDKYCSAGIEDTGDNLNVSLLHRQSDLGNIFNSGKNNRKWAEYILSASELAILQDEDGMFEGFQFNFFFGGGSRDNPVNNIYIDEVFFVKPCTVEYYNIEGEIEKTVQLKTGDFAENVLLSNVPDGKVQIGWSKTKNSNVIYDMTTRLGQDLQLYPVMEDEASDYEAFAGMYYDSIGGEYFQLFSDKSVLRGIMHNYQFDSYVVSQSMVVYLFGDNATTTATFNEQSGQIVFDGKTFAKTEVTVKVRFLDGETVLSEKTVPIGAKVASETAQRDGYEFAAWKKSDGTNFSFDSVISAALDLQVAFNPILLSESESEKYYASYYNVDKNILIELKENQILINGVAGEYLLLQSASLVDEFIVFNGKQGIITLFKFDYDGDTYTRLGQFTISFYVDATNTEAYKSILLENGKYLIETLPIEPTKDGFVFNGWYEDSNCTKKADFTKIFFESKSLYAGWTIDEAVAGDDTKDNETGFTFNSPGFIISIIAASLVLIAIPIVFIIVRKKVRRK